MQPVFLIFEKPAIPLVGRDLRFANLVVLAVCAACGASSPTDRSVAVQCAVARIPAGACNAQLCRLPGGHLGHPGHKDKRRQQGLTRAVESCLTFVARFGSLLVRYSTTT
jgi:hypothetical protein